MRFVAIEYSTAGKRSKDIRLCHPIHSGAGVYYIVLGCDIFFVRKTSKGGE